MSSINDSVHTFFNMPIEEIKDLYWVQIFITFMLAGILLYAFVLVNKIVFETMKRFLFVCFLIVSASIVITTLWKPEVIMGEYGTMAGKEVRVFAYRFHDLFSNVMSGNMSTSEIWDTTSKFIDQTAKTGQEFVTKPTTKSQIRKMMGKLQD